MDDECAIGCLVLSTYYWPVKIMKIIITSASFFRIRRRNEKQKKKKKKKKDMTTTIVPFQVRHLAPGIII
jgi:hypothetical protein